MLKKRKLSLNAKILNMALIPFILFLLAFMYYGYNSTRKALILEKKNTIHDVTTTVIAQFKSLEEKVLSGEISEAQAKVIAKHFVKTIRYGRDGDDYLWINDLTPFMVAHPSKALEGTDVTKFVDKKGKPLFLDIVKLVKEQNNGYIYYSWISKSDKNKFVDKLSYVELYKPWGWVVGTGIYLEDVEAYILKTFLQQIIFGVIGITLMGIFFFIILKKGVSNPLLQMAQRLRESSKNVTKGSEDTFETSDILSKATTEQAASLQETVASVDEISSMIGRNSDFAEQSKMTSDASQQHAIQGKQTVDQMVQTIEMIGKHNNEAMEQMESSNQKIAGILSIIKNIEDKTKVINDIVFQTKLLSFNASVEAARAGESGKGFAVVAEEVGNLANMSGKASDEIKQLLDESIKSVELIVSDTSSMVKNVIDQGKSTVEAGKAKAVQCKEVLDEIVKNVDEVNIKISEIASACREQSQGVNEITNAMRLLDDVTSQNNNAASIAARNAQELKAEANNLDQVVDQVLTLVEG
ncbi:methyl-accepting chemotaxis protein [Bacteriovorax sp. Seq25_V]|uniref:methyl-accepting chemotaxis protein n=1 Tax=Bacteriovorax sp. Seq25_V TaxID=1201288 RepID=UPI00038A49C4|nr:methyl-accepting chemotaxis protein [Bacteriovorax sp. Seq25_V]EQC43895.1 methyl-accepting chemotaxis protein signaling domain protein [Bacteriovorax sp. Seq25_V]